MPGSLLLRNVRPDGRASTDILIREGRIVDVGSAATTEASSVPVVDGEHALAVPGFVEAHTHLDKTLWGMPWHQHQAGPSLIDRIENERRLRGVLGLDPARQSSRQILQSIRMGTTHIRTHVDIDTEIGLKHFYGVLDTRAKLGRYVDLEIVAFPQSGLGIRPGTFELLDRALSEGADVVGGIDPSVIDRDPVRHVDAVFQLAQKHGKPVDIHLHEPGELGAFAIELIVERTRVLGMQGRVIVGHAFCLGMLDGETLAPLVDALAECQIAVMTTGPANRPCPPVKRLEASGVRLCSGSDGIRDTWGPYGNADMLERAMLLALRSGFRRDEELELALGIVTTGGARALGILDHGVAPGCRGDLVLLAHETTAEAIVSRGPRVCVIKAGEVVARHGECLVSA
jgi:cytosine/adenosine deaminase-related metal-dependent hydrolase